MRCAACFTHMTEENYGGSIPSGFSDTEKFCIACYDFELVQYNRQRAWENMELPLIFIFMLGVFACFWIFKAITNG